MQSNLITIFPGISLETEKYEWGEKKEDSNALNELIFNNSIITTLLKSKSNKKFTSYELKNLDQLNNKIIDAEGKLIEDYVVIKDKNLESDIVSPPNPDSQQLITYLSYKQHLDLWINLDLIKILCFKGGGRRIFINNRSEQWTPKYTYLLNIEQSHKRKLKIRKSYEKILIDVLAEIKNNDNDFYQKIITSISLFKESCRVNHLNPNSSVVLIVSAIEAILDLPRYSKKDNFSYALRLLYGFNNKIQEWASELYGLRSQIVHGDFVTGEKLLASKDKHYPHLSIARDMFHDCLMFVLDNYGRITIKRDYKFKRIKDLKNKVVSNKEKIENILRSKKRYSYQSFKKNRDFYKEFLLNMEGLTSTDYSGRKNILKLIKLIYNIIGPWIEEERKKKYNLNNKMIKEYVKFQEEKFNNIIKIFTTITNLNMNQNVILDLHDLITELEEEVRQLEPVVHKHDEFNFTITEFLDRSISSLFAIY